ncbi:MAG: polysaccharide biosynthesis C-terminal domain-containing protein [Candidatus Brocadiales bacterium]|nr:polysaccharide biosynthesis C-terminal domain-containing protein [Candidatus Bathyanammoxibius sp.]
MPVDATLSSSRRLTKAIFWTKRGGLAVLDQSLFAGAHFVLNILLARWLPAAEYGAFALAYSIFLLIATLHDALLIEPMMVFGAGKFAREESWYVGIILRGHMLLTLPIVMLMALLAYPLARFYTETVGLTFLALGLTMPLILLLWMVRRVFYVRLHPGWACLGSGFYFIIVVALAYAGYGTEKLSPLSAVLVMGVASLSASVVLLYRLSPQWRKPPSSELSVRKVVLEHWRYGRWALASAIAMWFPLNIAYLALPAWWGIEETGALRALMNFLNPILQGLGALSLLLVPVLVRHRNGRGIAQVNRTLTRFLALLLGITGAYLLLLLLFRVQMFEILYANKYVEHSGLPFILLILLPLAACFTKCFGSGLRALEQPSKVFRSYAIAAIFAVVLGLPLVKAYGILGASAGLALSYVLIASSMFILYWRATGIERTIGVGKTLNDWGTK